MEKKPYLLHNKNSHKNKKIQKAMDKHGVIAFSAFWVLLEILFYETKEKCLPCEYDTIAKEIGSDTEIIRSVVEDFGLFIIEETENGRFFKPRKNKQLFIFVE